MNPGLSAMMAIQMSEAAKKKQAEKDAKKGRAMHQASAPQFGSSSHFERWKAEQLKKKK